MRRTKVSLVLSFLLLPFSLAQAQWEPRMVYSFGPASGYPGQKGVMVPVIYTAEKEEDGFAFEMEVDSTKLSFADLAAIKGPVIDSICPEPDYWGVIVDQNRLRVGCILRYIGFIHFPVELEGDTLFKVVLDVNPDVIPPDSTLLDIKDIEYPIPGIWYHGIDGVFYIHQEGCEGPSGYSQPHQFELDQNYPNPFNSTTRLN